VIGVGIYSEGEGQFFGTGTRVRPNRGLIVYRCDFSFVLSVLPGEGGLSSL
jgi:hypothetical protein